MTTEVNTNAEQTEAEAPATPAKKEPKAPVRCKCSLYSKAVDQDGESVLVELVACTATTGGNFAPGHDAKLKSELIKLGAAGQPVYKTVGDEDVEMTAQDAANEYGFAAKVASGIERLTALNDGKEAKAAERAKAKEVREAERAAKKAEREKAAQAKKDERAKAAAEKKAAKEAAAAEAAKKAAEQAESTDGAEGDAKDGENLF